MRKQDDEDRELLDMAMYNALVIMDQLAPEMYKRDLEPAEGQTLLNANWILYLWLLRVWNIREAQKVNNLLLELEEYLRELGYTVKMVDDLYCVRR